MNTQAAQPGAREQELAEVILGYLEAAEAGQAPDRAQLLADHPSLAADLQEFFAGRDAVERVAGPLRGFVESGLASAVEGLRRRARPEFATPGGPLGELGDFRLLREIGRGGMGIVYEAHQISLNRRVALKVLPLAAALDPKHLQRFKHEAQAAAQLHHTNIVPVYAVGYERGVHYYAMQLIEGQSLSAIIEELQEVGRVGVKASPGPASALLDGLAGASPVPPAAAPEATALYAGAPSTGDADAPPAPEAPAAETAPVRAAHLSTDRSIKSQRYYRRLAHVGMKAAEALEHAHQLGVVHRDIKPANLLLDVRGNLWVTDFGLALFKDDSGLTMTGELLGTLRYMSPEQTFAKRGLVDHRADIYALGATLYELATLQPVFAGHDRQELLHQIAYEEPRAPRSINKSVPVELETILLKALAKNPDERYSSAQALADDLQRFLRDKPVLARRPTLVERMRKWARRHRPIVYSAAALLIMAVVGLSTAMVLICREHSKTLAALAEARVQRDRAEDNFDQARQAVDFFTEVAQEDLTSPDLEPVRRRMLERALRYYQGFLEQHHDDEALQASLIASSERVGNILAELGHRAEAAGICGKARDMTDRLLQKHPASPELRRHMQTLEEHLCRLQGVGELVLVKEHQVREALQLSKDQLRSLEDLAKEFSRGPCATMVAVAKLSPDQRHKKYLELVKANEKAVIAVLNDSQARRLKQIALQRRGPDAFFDGEVVAALGLSPQQQHQIAAIKAQECAGVACEAAWGDWKATQERKLARARAVERILAVLTPEQRTKWADLTGPCMSH